MKTAFPTTLFTALGTSDHDDHRTDLGTTGPAHTAGVTINIAAQFDGLKKTG